MKLLEIAIDGLRVCPRIHFSPLSPALNVVVGPTGSGKTTLRKILCDLLSRSDETSVESPWQMSGTGSVLVDDDGICYRLSYTERGNGRSIPSVEFVSGIERTGRAASGWSLGLDRASYETFFNVSLQEPHDLAPRLASLFQSRLGVRPGRVNWQDSESYRRWCETREAKRMELNAVEC